MKKQRINFLKECKMHLACSDDDIRPVMQYIYFKDGFAYASDAHILVKNKLSEITEGFSDEQLSLLDGKLMHKTSFRKILEYDFVRIGETGIECLTQFSTIEFRFSADASLKYPDAEAVISMAKEKNEPINRVSLSAKLYHRLYQSLYNDDRLVLNFSKSEHHGILVKSQDKYIESEAVIMPIMITE